MNIEIDPIPSMYTADGDHNPNYQSEVLEWIRTIYSSVADLHVDKITFIKLVIPKTRGLVNPQMIVDVWDENNKKN